MRHLVSFEGFRQHRLRMKNREKRKENGKLIPPPKPVEGEPVNPDESTISPESIG